MKFETEISFITVLKNNIVIIEGKEGIEVNKENATEVYNEIERKIEGDYKILIFRKKSYSVTPETYAVMNNRERLKKVSVVIRNKVGKIAAELEQSWCNKPMEIFSTEVEAMSWLTEE